MSDEDKSISEISRIDEECSLPVEICDDGAGNVLVADLEWLNKEVTLLVAPGTRIRFKVPPSGMHPVWVDYHWNGTNKRVINGVRYEGGSLWHTLLVPPEEDNRARLDGKYNENGSAESRWTSQHLVVRHPAAFDATNVFSLMVSGTARDGSIITLYANDYLTKLGDSTTAEFGVWRVLLYPHVKTQEFVLNEGYPGTTGRNPEAKRLIILKGPSIQSPTLNPPTADQKPVIRGGGAEPGARVSVYIAGTETPVVLNAPVNNQGEWSTTSTHTFELGKKYFINASQELSNVRSERGRNQEFHVLAPPQITKPVSMQMVEMTSLFEGRAPARFWQNTVTLYSEPSTNLGTAAVNYDTGVWTRNVTLTPGPHSIVGSHWYLGTSSVRSKPFTILVRPAKPTASFRSKGEGIELYGTGYNGTGVLVHVNHSSGTPYFEVQVVGGIWTGEIPQTYVPSLYNLAIRQSVSDGGSGRISSTESVRLDVRVPTPVPTGMAAAVSGQKATFSGRGRQWGTHEVKIAIYNNGTALSGVPQARVETNLNWQTAQSSDLAPGVYTNLTARQWVNNQWSADSARFAMTVASPAPEFINPPANAPTGLRPQISGSAWPGSTIVLKIPNKPDVTLTATGGTFTLNASADWTPGTYALSATAALGGGQPSAPGTRTFTVGAPVPIIATGAGAEVDLSAEIKGTGFPGCWVVIYSNTTHLPLGSNQVRADRGWTVILDEQAPQNLTVYAIQQDAQHSENKSAPSATLTVKVRVPRPGITVPAPNGKPPRTSTFSGTTTASQGTVELSIKGESQPFIRDIPLKPDGSWEATHTLTVGLKTIEARLRQKTYLSDPLERVITVVPAEPVVDTPRNGEAVGRLLRISGFGYPGDTVQIWRRGPHLQAIGNTVVTPAGKWSAYVPHGLTETVAISALARFEGHDSSISLPVNLPVLTPAPQITEPLHDDWVGVRPLYSGLATPGASITVASWFNATDVQAPVTEADVDGRWSVVGNKDLPVGAARVIVRQTLDGKASEWAESERFMVERKVDQFEAPTVHFPQMGQETGRWPMFSGAGEPGAEILICRVNDPNTVLATPRVDRHGKWAVRSQVELPVAESFYTYSVRQSRDGVSSKWLLPNPTVKVIQVSDSFQKPIIDLPAGLTLETRPLFFGRGMPGAELRVYRHDFSLELATTRVDAQGNWSVRCAVDLFAPNPSHSIVAQQITDGQYSAWSDVSSPFQVAEKIDPPVILSPAEGALISPREVIRGTAIPGVEVRLYIAGIPSVVRGKGVADALGQWVIVLDGLPLNEVTLGGKGYKDDLQSIWMPARTFTVIDVG